MYLCVYLFVKSIFIVTTFTFFFFSRLLHAQAVYCKFEGAAETYELALCLIEQLKKADYTAVNHAALYTEFSVLFFMRSEYHDSYR